MKNEFPFGMSMVLLIDPFPQTERAKQRSAGIDLSLTDRSHGQLGVTTRSAVAVAVAVVVAVTVVQRERLRLRLSPRPCRARVHQRMNAL